MRFVVDANVSGQGHLRALKKPYDIVFVVDMNKTHQTTDAIASFACSDDRILITNDMDTYRIAYDRAIRHPGLIETKTQVNSIASGEALLALLSRLADDRDPLNYEALKNTAIKITFDDDGTRRHDLFEPFPQLS